MTYVEMSDLDPATLTQVNDASAEVLLRSGFTDYRAAVSLIRNINLAILTPIPAPSQNDLLYLQRSGQSYSVTFGQIGFDVGIMMWFYRYLPPAPNWNLVPNTGNSLLACADQSAAPYGGYAGGGAGANRGSWQQTDTVLTIEQIPAHSHQALVYKNKSSTVSKRFASTQTDSDTNVATTAPTGGQGSTSDHSTNPPGATLGHNHGNTWRPMANVGTIGVKVS